MKKDAPLRLETPWVYFTGRGYMPFPLSTMGKFKSFVYLITNTRSLHKYIGAKNVDKGEPWVDYHGSCMPLKEEMHLGGTRYWQREILKAYTTNKEAFAVESMLQKELKVLHIKHKAHGGHLFYNGCVGKEYIRRDLREVGVSWGSPEDRATHNEKWRERG